MRSEFADKFDNYILTPAVGYSYSRDCPKKFKATLEELSKKVFSYS